MPNLPSTINHQPSTELISNEIKFIIACCQTEPSKTDINFILSYLSQMPRQEMPLGYTNAPSGNALEVHQTLITAATQHGILPLVYKTIKSLRHPELVSESPLSSQSLEHLLADLKSEYSQIAQRNMFMSAELIRIMHLFKENSIEALAFKGPALSQMAYGDITLRQYGDLDILIKKEDITKVEALCISRGYIPYYDLTEVQKEAWYTYAKDMVFYHPKKKSIIEIHWLLLDADFPLQVDLDATWKHTDTVEINKHSVQTFSSESLLLYLCIHGSKHLWERVIWIKDIDLMIRTQDINWKNILVDAQKNNFESMLFLGLYLSKTLFDTPLPKNVQKILESETILPELSNFVFENWENTLSIFQNTKAMLKFFPTLKMKVLYLHKIILKPSNNEYRFIDLPRGLYWVYYLVRPYLLFRKYLTKDQ